MRLPLAPDSSFAEFPLPTITPGGSLSVRLTGRAADAWPNPGKPAFVGLIGVYVSNRLVGGVQVICLKDKLKLDLGSAGKPHTNGVEVKMPDRTFSAGGEFALRLDLNDGSTGRLMQGSAVVSDRMPRSLSGGPVVLRIGQEGIADGAYFPPERWRWDSLEVETSGSQGGGGDDSGGSDKPVAQVLAEMDEALRSFESGWQNLKDLLSR